MAAKKVVSAGPAKKVVQAEPALSETKPGSSYVASPEGKKKASNYRIIAAIFWAVAIGLELFVIFWLLKHTEFNYFMVALIAGIVIIGVLAVIGSQFWKKANRFDPASEKDKVRFFIQNQLGAIITIVAFIPLIILIFTNKNMSQGQKTLAGIVGIVIALLAGGLSADWAPPSQEKMDEQTAIVFAYTGKGTVYWVAGGSVYHLCAEYPAGTTIPALSRGGEDNVVFEGTVAKAVEENKTRLSMYGYSECGLTEGQPAYPEYLNGADMPGTDPTDQPT